MARRIALLCAFFVFLSLNLYGANIVVAHLQAAVPVQQSITIENVTMPSTISEITPTGDFSTDINDTCWNVVDPIIVQLAVTNNATARKLVVFTNHRDTSRVGAYWPTQLNHLEADVTINGLINVSLPWGRDSWYQYTAPMRAYFDRYHQGVSTDDLDWQWITDVSSVSKVKDYLTPTPKIAVLYDGDIVANNVDVYIKTCWDNAKEGGDYKAKLIFAIIGQ